MKKNNLAGVFVLLVFTVFMVSVLLILLSGADTVQKLTNRDQQTYSQRTAVQYLATRVRQADRRGTVRTDEAEGTSVLILTEEIEGAEYCTMVYCYDGYLRELFAAQGEPFAAEDGEQVLRAEALTLSLENQVITAEITDSDGQVRAMTLYLRSGEGRGR